MITDRRTCFVSVFLFDYIIYFDAFFYNYFEERKNCKSYVY